MSDTSHGTNADDGQFNPLIPEGPPPGEDREAVSYTHLTLPTTPYV